jgi:hypothetical protein
MIDDDDFIDIDEGDAPRSPLNRSGVLVVPGIAVTEAAFAAESIGFSAARPVLIVQFDDADEETIVNLGELRDAGFTGSRVDEAEDWLSPINEPTNPERDAAIIAARGDL